LFMPQTKKIDGPIAHTALSPIFAVSFTRRGSL
jgi:hypothetical protein